LLMRKTGNILSRAIIADQVWDINFESNTNFVDVHIRRLRAKVDDPFAKKLIHTVRGKGYVLEDRGLGATGMVD
jgi:two-component system, OmpR family, copper resistance phosphate regulon response regulator CusR